MGKTLKYLLFFIILISFMASMIGCGYKIPQMKHASEVEKKFNVPFDRVWSSVLEVAKLSNAKMIIEDKPSGLIVCTIPVKIAISPYNNSEEYWEYEAKLHMAESKVYVSIFVKSIGSSGPTIVFLSLRFRYGPYIFTSAFGEDFDREFFKKLVGKIGG